MRTRCNGKRLTRAAVSASLALLALLILPSFASAEETMLFKGNGFAVRPAIVSGWDYDGHQSGRSGGQTVAGLEGKSTNHWPDGFMKWKQWGKNRAVGIGGLVTYCGTLPAAECRSSPWYGAPRVKLRAFGPKSGHFTKMKISETKDPQHYMVLRFKDKPGANPTWSIVREVGGNASRVLRQKKPPTLLYYGNGFAHRPKTVTGWTRDDAGSTAKIFGGTQGENTGKWRRIAWNKWNHVRAIGYGRMFSPDCTVKPCDDLYPWNGTRGRVVADRTADGHFTRMKFTTRDGPLRPYELTVRYVGLRKSGISWKIIREVGAES